MKKLIIRGLDNHVLASILIDLEGEDYALVLPLPMFLPVVAISLTDLEEEEEEEIEETIKRTKGVIE